MGQCLTHCKVPFLSSELIGTFILISYKRQASQNVYGGVLSVLNKAHIGIQADKFN